MFLGGSGFFIVMMNSNGGVGFDEMLFLNIVLFYNI